MEYYLAYYECFTAMQYDKNPSFSALMGEDATIYPTVTD